MVISNNNITYKHVIWKINYIVILEGTLGDKSLMRKQPGNVYDKCNITVVICDTDIL
jgi:hypothetical protein